MRVYFGFDSVHASTGFIYVHASTGLIPSNPLRVQVRSYLYGFKSVYTFYGFSYVHAYAGLFLDLFTYSPLWFISWFICHATLYGFIYG